MDQYIWLLYNRKIKEKYILKKNDEKIAAALVYISDIEESYNKDLYNFNFVELDYVFNCFQFNHISKAIEVRDIFKNYINWAYANCYKQRSCNLLYDFLDYHMEDYVKC